MKYVVIIGGGYAGIKAVETFAKSRLDNLEVLLIDQHMFHYLQTESYNLVASKILMEKTFIYLPTLIAGFGRNFRFVCDKAVSIEETFVVCKNKRYFFDYVIIATGSVTRFLHGFEEKGKFALGIKSLRSALKVRSYFEEELFARLEEEVAKKSFNILVIGGGLSGVEVAAEMQDYFNAYTRTNALSCGKIHIKLVSKHILKQQNRITRIKTENRLKKLGVETICAHVKHIENNQALLADNRQLRFDFAIFTGGIEPSSFIRDLPFEKDEKGFLIVDKFLQVFPHIFATGDVAKLLDKKGIPIPPTAQSAEASGIIAANNIIALIENRMMQAADIRLRGLAIALGGNYAIVVTPLGFNLYGSLGWLVKKGIEQFYKIPLKIKAQKGYEMINLCQKKIENKSS